MKFGRDFLLNIGGGVAVAVGGQAFHDLRCYYEAMEAHLAAHLERNIGRFSPTLREHIEWEHLFPSLLRESVVVSIMSTLEYYLNNICDDVRTILREPLSHRDLRGGCTQRAQIFLVKVGRLQRPGETTWQRIHDAQRLRNLLVHNGGVLEAASDQNDVQRLAEKLPGLAYDEEKGFTIQGTLCLYYLDLVDEVHREFSIELQEVCNRIQRFEKGR
jgi:hypothetical protein